MAPGEKGKGKMVTMVGFSRQMGSGSSSQQQRGRRERGDEPVATVSQLERRTTSLPPDPRNLSSAGSGWPWKRERGRHLTVPSRQSEREGTPPPAGLRNSSLEEGPARSSSPGSLVTVVPRSREASQGPVKVKEGEIEETAPGSSSRQERGRQPRAPSRQSEREGTPLPAGLRNLSLEDSPARSTSRGSAATEYFSLPGSRETSQGPALAGQDENEDIIEEFIELPAARKLALWTLKLQIHVYPFEKSHEEEAAFFRDPQFTHDDLFQALLYVYGLADEKVAEYRLFLTALTRNKEERVSMKTFVDADSEDEVRVIPLRMVAYTGYLKNFTGDSRVPRTIVALAKIYKKAEMAAEDLEGEAKGNSDKHRFLKEWVESPDRLNATPRTTPMSLLSSKFTQEDLLDTAVYAKRQQAKWIALYDKFMQKALKRYTEIELVEMEIQPLKMILRDRDSVPNMINFMAMEDEHIRAMGHGPVCTNPISDRTHCRTETMGLTHALAGEGNNWLTKVEKDRAEALQNARKPPKNFEWSLNMCAKYGKVMEKHYRGAVKRLPQFRSDDASDHVAGPFLRESLRAES